MSATEYYRTIGKDEYHKLINGETIVPINSWEHAQNSFPKTLKGVYLYIRDAILDYCFYNFMGGDYIVILNIPDERILAKGRGSYVSDIPDENGWCGIVTVDEVMVESYSIKDVVKIIDVKKECYDGDDLYILNIS